MQELNFASILEEVADKIQKCRIKDDWWNVTHCLTASVMALDPDDGDENFRRDYYPSLKKGLYSQTYDVLKALRNADLEDITLQSIRKKYPFANALLSFLAVKAFKMKETDALVSWVATNPLYSYFYAVTTAMGEIHRPALHSRPQGKILEAIFSHRLYEYEYLLELEAACPLWVPQDFMERLDYLKIYATERARGAYGVRFPRYLPEEYITHGQIFLPLGSKWYHAEKDGVTPQIRPKNEAKAYIEKYNSEWLHNDGPHVDVDSFRRQGVWVEYNKADAIWVSLINDRKHLESVLFTDLPKEELNISRLLLPERHKVKPCLVK
jgi:hypothetical protein